jgi:hypothetical protein
MALTNQRDLPAFLGARKVNHKATGDRGTLLKWPPVAWVSQVRFSPRWSGSGIGKLAATAAATKQQQERHPSIHVTTFFNYLIY